MNSKLTHGLLLAIVLMLALVYMVTRTGNDSGSEIGQNLYPDLRDQLATVDRVSVSSGDRQATIVKSEGIWRVSDRFDYPASFEMVSNLLNSLKSAKYLERKTSKSENHARLGLSDPAAEDSESSTVKVFSGDQQLAALILGNSSSHLGGTYFRFIEDDQVWLMDQTPGAVAGTADWLEPVIVNIAEEDIVKVIQSSASGESITVVREADAASNFVPVNVPAVKKLKYPSVANQLGRSLVNVNLEDVRAAGEFDWSGANKTEFFSKDNLHLTVLSKQLEENYYLGFASRVLDEEGSDQQAVELAAKLTAWVFQVSEYTYKDFAKTGTDLFEDEVSDQDDQSTP
jgi:hypothetical protein